MSPILGILASARSAANAANSYESIATVTVGSGGSSTVSFTSIPSTYQHLQIRGIGRNTYLDTFTSFTINFNSDTGSNYAWHYLYGDGSTALAGAATTQTVMREINFASGNLTTGVFSGFVIDALDYANTNKNKTIRILGGGDANGSGAVNLSSGVWLNTSAVTTITLTPSNSGNFAQYSSFALYGIKG